VRGRSIEAGTRPEAGMKVNNSKTPKCESEMSNGLNGNELKKTEGRYTYRLSLRRSRGCGHDL
jgi:hypothetical protein